MELTTEYHYSEQCTKLSLQKINSTTPAYSISGYLHEVQKFQRILLEGVEGKKSSGFFEVSSVTDIVSVTGIRRVICFE